VRPHKNSRTGRLFKVYGLEDDKYLLADPLLDKPLILVDEDTLRESFDTLATKKKRDHKMIVF
ncbi:hypothetical protein GOV10_05160, partial [Candidatus Woesearchaeota archaeon]|nr:hypothetical protein [Candidatus Woesearchaeota archaeon]